MKQLLPLYILLAVLLTACTPSVPDQAQKAGHTPHLQPDYIGVTIPSNICPLNFMVAEAGDKAMARLTVADEEYIVASSQKKIQFDEERWSQLLAKAGNDGIKVEVWSHDSKGWTAYDPFTIHVAPEPIDPWISYRLIPPSYVGYEELVIAQRNLTTFDEKVIYNNMLLTTETQGQCINCHSYQNYHTSNMLFHIRKDFGGTMLVHDGQVSKLDLKTPETISAGVYPAWHPTESLIAFSTNLTAQIFHNSDTAKIEVFDGASDLILYDVDKAEVTSISSLQDQMEIFPTWSPDGRWLYFCSARAPFDASPVDSLGQARDLKGEAINHLEEIRYDLYRMPFDAQTRSFGPRQLLYQASADSMSVTLPRLSPDGRWIAFARGNYGCFQVWHHEADIWLLDTELFTSGDTLSMARPMELTNINSSYSESYPTFSSNGHWIMTASRRDDNNFTRPYIAYFHADGTCDKPFEMPLEDPEMFTLGVKSYNRPEFMVEPVKVKPQEFARVSKDGIAIQAAFKK